MTNHFICDKIAIIGTGLIGGSLALACKKNNICKEITGYSRRQQTIDKTLELNLIDSGSTEIKNAVYDADIIMLATPLSTYSALAAEISKYMKNGAILTDAGSVKTKPIQDILNVLNKNQHEYFVPGHPIAGTENSGPEAAFAELYEDKKTILTPLNNTNKQALEKITNLWQGVGSEVDILDAKRHDSIYAIVSHSAQFLSWVFSLNIINNEGLKIEKHTDRHFHKFIRLCGSDVTMWQDIFIENFDNLSYSLDIIFDKIQNLKKDIEDSNISLISTNLERARAERLKFHERLKGEYVDDFRPLDYSAAPEEIRTWLEYIPRIISYAIMDSISENEYDYATGSGLHGITKNIILSGQTNADDLIENKDLIFKAMSDFSSIKNQLISYIESDQNDKLFAEITEARNLYNIT